MLESTEQNEARLEKVHRYYQRWEGCYNSPKGFSPLTDISKIEQFARRIAQPVTYESELRKALATQHAIIILEKQIQAFGAVPITYEEGWSTPAESTTCETKSTPQPEVGRNSPCPCGSGKKYKRCCGVNAPPVLNKAA